MTDPITTIVNQLQTYTRSLPGVRGAPNEPPDQLNIFPFAVSAFRRGSVTIAPVGTMKLLGTWVIQIHTTRKNLPRDYKEVMPLGNALLQLLLQNLTLNSTVETINDIRIRFLQMEYGGIETLGWDVEIDAKLQVNL